MWLKLDLSGIKLSMQIEIIARSPMTGIRCGARLTLHLSLMSG